MTWPDLIQLLSGRPLFVQVVTWIGLLMLLSIAVALVHLLLLRIRLRYFQREQRSVRETWLPVLRELRDGHAVDLPAIRGSRRYHLLELWVEERELADAEYGKSLNSLAFEVGLDDTLCTLLQLHRMVLVRRKVWLQALAITAAEWLDTDRTRAALSAMIESDSYFLASKACAALVKLDDESAEQAIIGTLFRFPKHAPYLSVQLSQAGAASVLHALEPFFDLLPAYTEMNFVSLVERTEDSSLLPVLLRRLAADASDDEKAAILRALGRIGGDAEREAVIPYLANESVRLRIQAIKTLGKIGRVEDRALLVPHLADPDWWVRYRSARSYIKLGRGREEDLEPFIGSLSDPYSRDILHHAAAELTWWNT